MVYHHGNNPGHRRTRFGFVGSVRDNSTTIYYTRHKPDIAILCSLGTGLFFGVVALVSCIAKGSWLLRLLCPKIDSKLTKRGQHIGKHCSMVLLCSGVCPHLGRFFASSLRSSFCAVLSSACVVGVSGLVALEKTSAVGRQTDGTILVRICSAHLVVMF